MRKLLSLLLVCLFVLTGCGSGDSSNDNRIQDATTLAELSGFRIAAQAGTFHYDALDQIDNVVKSSYPEFTDLLIALKSKAIDGYVAEEPTAISVISSDDSLTYVPLINNATGFTASEDQTSIAIGVRQGSDLTEQINTVLESISYETRSALMAQMVRLASGQEVDSLALRSEEPTEYNGVLRVAMECAYEPYNWTENGEATIGAVAISGEGKEGLYANGYDVQIAKYVANTLGLRLEIYSMEWDSLVPAVQSGAVDAIVAGMSPTEERKAVIDFTNSYFDSNLVVIINK